jgi:hypothetical protein
MAIATVGAILACASSAFAANAGPDASFGFFPRDPVSGQTIRFVSYACDPDGRLAGQAWDLDDDGAFDDALGATASRRFLPGAPSRQAAGERPGRGCRDPDPDYRRGARLARVRRPAAVQSAATHPISARSAQRSRERDADAHQSPLRAGARLLKGHRPVQGTRLPVATPNEDGRPRPHALSDHPLARRWGHARGACHETGSDRKVHEFPYAHQPEPPAP